MIYQGSTPEEIYAAICIAATLMVPGCEHASIMLRHKDTYTTIAANDSVAREVDQLEQALNEGPCLDAIEKEAPQVDPDLSTRSRWPVLAARVIAETPVRGVMGFRLLVGRRKVGALNLVSDTSSTFDKVSVERATLLAAFATVATNAVAQGEDEASLQRALVSNREIGKAIGILMMLNDISEDQAFNMLRRISQDTNVRLAAIAAKIVRRQNSTA
ncbi:MAG: GAF and ANTAR domain-containing protein [Mycobacterium sp.]